ncbi:coiled-coil domain-containing protein 190-like [Mya arenaria]|uniref:coiled-coil domain-containing protein 190-like n=1 Tax=Mya arenaria TaxID=6604 RepID=UPI0022E30FFF|nr:coiled-coil domain-containing protein 190-like [Mya arenaria]
MSTSDPAVTETKSKADDKKSKPVPKAMFPNSDPDKYNPDGSLRTVHQMPEFDQRWEQAEKARYIRTRNLPERDRELSVNEIFGQGEQTKS